VELAADVDCVEQLQRDAAMFIVNEASECLWDLPVAVLGHMCNVHVDAFARPFLGLAVALLASPAARYRSVTNRMRCVHVLRLAS